MLRVIYILTLTALVFNCSQKKNKLTQPTEEYELTPNNAHPSAKRLLAEDFYWSMIEETAPFGNDDGFDSFHGFVEWRQENRNESPVIYIKELIDEWGYETFDLSTIHSEEIRQLLNNIDTRMLVGQDNAIIAVGFGQFVLEGKIDSDIKDLTKKALKRQLTTELINEFRTDYRETRREQLEKMLAVVDKM